MSYNISDLLPKKYDKPGEKFRKRGGDLDDAEKALSPTTDTVVKEGNTDMVDKKVGKTNVVKESITPTISERKIDTINKTEKSQASNKTVDTPRRN